MFKAFSRLFLFTRLLTILKSIYENNSFKSLSIKKDLKNLTYILPKLPFTSEPTFNIRYINNAYVMFKNSEHIKMLKSKLE